MKLLMYPALLLDLSLLEQAHLVPFVLKANATDLRDKNLTFCKIVYDCFDSFSSSQSPTLLSKRVCAYGQNVSETCAAVTTTLISPNLFFYSLHQHEGS